MGTRASISAAVLLLLSGCAQTHSLGDPPAPPPPRPPGELPPTYEPPPTGPFALPPISGGSLAIGPDGRITVVDPHAGLLAVVDPASRAVVASRDLEPLDEPGRVIVDPSGRVHVVLRRPGDVLTLDADLALLARRHVCEAPRGLAHDPAGDRVHVACASGELVSLPAADGEVVRRVMVAPDLRDVVRVGDRLYVSVFRSAELLTLDANGAVLETRRPSVQERMGGRDPVGITLTPNVAWRLRALDDGRIMMVHQRSVSSTINVDESGYAGGDCRNGVVQPAVSLFGPTGAPTESGAFAMTTLVVDAALAPDGGSLYLADAANDHINQALSEGLHRVEASTFTETCSFAEPLVGSPRPLTASTVAVEVLADGTVVSQVLGSQALLVFHRAGVVAETVHPRPSGATRGLTIFHTSTPSRVACASCHPEGGEDGMIWDFAGTGARRTQTLLGGILETAPFHWSGDQPSMGDIMAATFANRMSAPLEEADTQAVAEWLDAQPVDEGPVHDDAAWSRGQSVFERDCAGCHAGERLTDNRSVDVGTGGRFQVPSLRGVAYRAPYLHDGCATSLDAVLEGACGTSATHGSVGALASGERLDLLAYVRSL